MNSPACTCRAARYMRAKGRILSAPASRASRTARVVNSCHVSSSHMSLATSTASQNQRMTSFSFASGVPPERLQRAPQRRRTRDVALGEPRRQTVQEDIDQPRRLRPRRRSRGGLGHVPQSARPVQAAGEDRRSQRFEVRLTRLPVAESFESVGGVDQQRHGVPAALASEDDLGAEPGQSARAAARPADPVLPRRGARDAASGDPASKLACAAAIARAPRAAGSGVSSVARLRKAAAAATPPRARARSAERSSSPATASSGSTAAWARCHARRSGSDSGSVASASARCTS